jgi:hypothetical protein
MPSDEPSRDDDNDRQTIKEMHVSQVIHLFDPFFRRNSSSNANYALFREGPLTPNAAGFQIIAH